MSIVLENAVWSLRDPSVRGATRLVFLALANFADEDGGSIFPSHDTLAEKTGVSKRSVQYALSRLERAGYIEITVNRGRFHTNDYRINTQYLRIMLAENTQPTHDKTRKREQQNTQPEAQNTQSTTQNTQNTAIKHATIAYNSSVKHQENHQETHQGESAHAHAHEGALEVSSNGNGNGNANNLRQFLALQAGPPGEGAYPNFEAFWRALLAEYPKAGKTDLDEAKDIARGLEPADWGEVVVSARTCRLSDRTARGYVRNLPNFLRGRSWVPYSDGPIKDARAPTQQEENVLDLSGLMGRAAEVRARFEQDRGLR